MRQALAPLLGALLCLALGLALWVGPHDPDVPFAAREVWGVFLIFSFWCAGVLTWGGVLTRALGLGPHLGPWLGPVALGTAGAALTAAGFAELGWIGPGRSAPLLSLLALGWVLELPHRLGARPEPQPGKSGAYALLTGLVLFLVVAARVLLAATPRGGSDPLMYHLLAPRLWWEAGGTYLPPSNYTALVASYWDDLSLWANALLAGKNGGGLAEVELFGQWTHAALGFGGALLAGRRLLRPLVPREARWLGPATLALASSYSLRDYTWVAKNDWGVAAWLLTGTALALEGARPGVAGFFLGLAFAAKFSSFYFLLPFGAVWLIRGFARGGRAFSPSVLRAAAGFALAATPLFLRNYALTGNPVFPWLTQHFASHALGPTVARNVEGSRGIFSFGRWLIGQKLALLLRESPFNRAVLLVPAAFALDRGQRRLLPLWGAALGALLLFVGRDFGEFAFLRWIGAGLLIFAALNFLALAGLVERLPAPFEPLKAALAAGALLYLGAAAIPWAELAALPGEPEPAAALRDFRRHPGGEAKAWLRLHARPGDLIVSTADNQSYLIAPLAPLNLIDNARLDREFFGEKDPAALIDGLRGYGIRYLLDTLHWDTFTAGAPVFWGAYSYRLNGLLMSHADAIAFTGTDALVVDLERLAAELRPVCGGDETAPGYGQFWNLL